MLQEIKEEINAISQYCDEQDPPELVFCDLVFM
jgi:hypothetical protein